MNPALHNLEVLTSSSAKAELPYPPIFIIGAPRSGSTLLYQVLTDYYDIGYLSNLHCLFFGAPSFLERLFHPLKKRQQSNYRSCHGQTQGWTAPSECGEFWYRFFRRKPQYIPLEEADPQQLGQLRGAVSALVNALGKPVLFKNLNCALRLQPTFKVLPEALFIVTHRQPIDNGHSLLEVRKKVHGNYRTWWSMEPPEIDKLKTLPPHQQVVQQIRQIESLIERDRQIIGPNRFMDVQYEEFCRDTYSSIQQLDDFLKGHGVKLEKSIGIAAIPSHFKPRQEIRIEQQLYSELVSYVNEQK